MKSYEMLADVVVKVFQADLWEWSSCGYPTNFENLINVVRDTLCNNKVITLDMADDLAYAIQFDDLQFTGITYDTIEDSSDACRSKACKLAISKLKELGWRFSGGIKVDAKLANNDPKDLYWIKIVKLAERIAKRKTKAIK
jgi:hypothetical protein